MKMFCVTCSFLLVMTLSATAQDQSCSEQSIKGAYGFVSSVRIVPPPKSPVNHTARARFIGLITYDGTGKAQAAGITVGPTGTNSSYSSPGTYKINAQSCTGSVEFETKQNGKSKWDFVIVSGGTQLLTIVENESNSTPFPQVKR